MPRKKVDNLKITYRIPKDIYDLLMQEKKKSRKTENAIVIAAIEEYLAPHEKITHERDSKMSFNALLKRQQALENKVDLFLLFQEEFARTFYFNTQTVEHENIETQKKRMEDGIDNIFHRVELSITGQKDSILKRFKEKETKPDAE